MSQIAITRWIGSTAGTQAEIVKDDGPWTFVAITSANTADWALLQSWIAAGHEPDPIPDMAACLPR